MMHMLSCLPLVVTLPDSGTVLFVHTNYPAQFRFLVKEYIARGWSVYFASHTCKNIPLPTVHHIQLQHGKPRVKGSKLEKIEASSLQAFGDLLAAKRKGLQPDLIYCHNGWGLGTFLKDLFPRSKIIAYSEWWFNFHSEDFAFDPGSIYVPHSMEARLGMLLRNQGFALELLHADAIVAPTHWQRQQLIPALRKHCHVIFDGIDLAMFSPGLPSNLAATCLDKLPDQTPLLTYATRGLEPYRGFPEFAAAALELLQAHPDWHVAIAGKDAASYYKSKQGDSFGVKAMEDFEAAGVVDRVHMLGQLPLTTYRDLLLRSDLHCYFTRPYVLSWSLLESSLCGCRLISSDVGPVREFLQDDPGTTLLDHTASGLGLQLAEIAGQNKKVSLQGPKIRLELAKRRREERNGLARIVERDACMARHIKLAESLLTAN